MRSNQTLALTALLIVGLAACKKDTEDPTPTTPAEVDVHATIRMKFSFMLGTNPYTTDSVLHDGSGHALKVDGMRFFVSGAHAINDEEEEVGHFEDKYLLVDATTSNNFLLGTVFTSHIHEFHFDLGVDTTANHDDVATAAAPLNEAAMHYGTNAEGYKFVSITGNADLDGNGSFETPISFICGTDALLTDAHAHVHHDLSEGETFTGQALVNMAGLFSSIDVSTGTHMFDATTSADVPICTQLMTNLSAAIDGVE